MGVTCCGENISVNCRVLDYGVTCCVPEKVTPNIAGKLATRVVVRLSGTIRKKERLCLQVPVLLFSQFDIFTIYHLTCLYKLS